MRIRLLGPVDVLVDEVPRPVNGLRRKAVLAALALQPGEVVSIDRLIDIVWDERAPATAPTTLQSHMSELRRVLGERTAILAQRPGYRLNIDGEATDVQAAQRLIRQGTRCADPGERQARLQAAVSLWRGRPLADVTPLAWFERQAQRLDDLLLQARHALIDARLTLGEHAQVIPELEDLCSQYPLHEQTHGQLMLALYRAGRQADALAAYRRLRRTLDSDLGIGPSQPLRELETAILRQDPTLDLPPPARPAATGVMPAQLPPTVATLSGRTVELAQLDRLVARADPGAGTARPIAAAICVISGTAGIGKTTLAVHWAHQVAARFPDGQLHVNLRGFDPSGTALTPGEALRRFLDAFGVPTQRIPAGLDAQVDLYRSLLAGKRILVVLDNARDVEQVRPLLPGSPGCVAVVTSRGQLTPLVATEGAHLLTLDLLSAAESRDLLTRRLGAARIAAEPGAVDDIIAHCARLPLALAIAAARAATHPAFALATLAADLRTSTGALGALDAGDPASDARAVFSWSYRALDAAAARLFRLLGLHPGPDITAPAAASLAGLPMAQVRPLLASLTGEHLIVEHVPGRYTFHDLLRTYASEQVRATERDHDRAAAVRRTMDHYVHTAHAAALLLEPGRGPLGLGPAHPGTVPEPLTDYTQALAWFTAEHRVLLAAIDHAAGAGRDADTWQLAWTLVDFLDRRGHWQDWVASGLAAVAATRPMTDARAQAHRDLAGAYARLGRLDDAHGQLHQALDLYRRRGDQTGQAFVHHTIAAVWEQHGDQAAALDHAHQALDLYRAVGHRAGEARIINGIGWTHALLGDYSRAISACRQALALSCALGDRVAQAAIKDSLGYAHHHLGEHTQAIAYHEAAIGIYRSLGERYGEANSMVRLGETHHAAGNPDAARTAWQHALEILHTLDHPDADRVRALLGRPPTAADDPRGSAGAVR